MEDQLVGVTHECDYPPAVRRLPTVTRTRIPSDATSAQIDHLVREQLRTKQALYSLDLAALEALRPDLIVTQALCDVCAVAEDEVAAAACSLPGHPLVINLEPRTLTQVFDSILQVAQATDAVRAGRDVVAGLTARVDAVVARTANVRERPRVALLEWLDPPFACGHWSPELVRLAGGREGLGREGQRSRTLSWHEIEAWQPEVVFIACCGFDVARTLDDVSALQSVSAWRGLPAVRARRVYVANGADYFSRPGPRLVDSLEILAHTLHPTLHLLPRDLPPPARVAA